MFVKVVLVLLVSLNLSSKKKSYNKVFSKNYNSLIKEKAEEVEHITKNFTGESFANMSLIIMMVYNLLFYGLAITFVNNLYFTAASIFFFISDAITAINAKKASVSPDKFIVNAPIDRIIFIFVTLYNIFLLINIIFSI